MSDPTQLPTFLPVNQSNIFPASFPVPEPLILPISSPTSLPLPTHSPIPSLNSILLPTQLSILLPSSLSVTQLNILPTSLPTPSTTQLPTPAAVTPPIEVATPTHVPTPVLLQQLPSLSPTTIDIVSVYFEIVLSTSKSTISDDEKAFLQETVATKIGLSIANVKNFAVTMITPSVGRRRLLTSYMWDVSFNVVAALSSSSAETLASFAERLKATLESDAFALNVASYLGVAVTIESIAMLIETSKLPLEHSSAPLSPPTPKPTPHPSQTLVSIQNDSEMLLSATNAAKVGAVFLICLAGAAFLCLRARNK
jgi:hypothetical protein